MIDFDKPEPSTRDCLWCGNPVNMSLSTRWDAAPWVGDRVTHFSCIESMEAAARTLLANLAVAGAIQLGIDLGAAAGYDDACIDEGYMPLGCWRPNTLGQSVAGMERK